jgi:hypothetical protein
MNIETITIDSIYPDPANARKHSTRNLSAIAASLKRFGQQKPIVVDSKCVVRAGNGTLAAAKQLGWKTIEVVRSDLPLSELAAYAIADNRTAELAEWDDKALTALLADVNIGDVGFTNEEIEKICGSVPELEDEQTVAESIEETYEVVVTCEDETQQQSVFDQLTSQGYSCRLFTL